jgi:hypothetical protein
MLALLKILKLSNLCFLENNFRPIHSNRSEVVL